jgi:hypothetical protein
MRISEKENWLRAVEFRHPEWIPCHLGCHPSIWKRHRDDLAKLCGDHPRTMQGLDPRMMHAQSGADLDYDRMPLGYQAGQFLTDKWGCGRITIQDGIAGEVVKHPLADWKDLATYRPPNPLEGTLDEVSQGASAYLQGKTEPMKWSEVDASVSEQKRQGGLVAGDGEKLLDRLYFLRGFENLMMDFADEPPELARLIAMLEEYEMKLVHKWLSLGVDYIFFHTDFASQQALMISPAAFRKWLTPLFTRLFQTCRKAGVHVYLSSNGCTLDAADDLVESGVSIHDPQVAANTLEGIARTFKGRLCVDVDLEQGSTFMKPGKIRDLVKATVDLIGAPEGGLMIGCSFTDPNVSLKTIETFAEAMERCCFPQE